MANKYYYLRGGAERYVFELTELLESHGHTVIPFTMKHVANKKSAYDKYFVSNEDYNEKKGIMGKLKTAGRFIYSFEAKRKFEQLLIDEQPDVVHVNNIYHQISPSILDVCKRHGVPVVQTVHDYKLICPNYKLFVNGKIDEGCKGGRFYHDIFNRSVRGSISAGLLAAIEMYVHAWLGSYRKGVDAWIAPSSFVASKLVEYGMVSKKIKTLYHFQDSSKIKPHYQQGKYLLCFGRLSEEKGFDVAIRAMQYIDGILHIVGEGPEREELERIAEEVGVSDRVVFLGYKQGAALSRELNGASIVLMPSIWYEVFGYSLVEALAAGKVVVGSRVGAIPELLGAVDERLTFEMGNPHDLAAKVNWLLGHRGEMEKIAKKGRKFVEKELDPEAYYEALMKVYKAVIRGKK